LVGDEDFAKPIAWTKCREIQNRLSGSQFSRTRLEAPDCFFLILLYLLLRAHLLDIAFLVSSFAVFVDFASFQGYGFVADGADGAAHLVLPNSSFKGRHANCLEFLAMKAR
jgi:hypothetical protein